MKKRDPSPRELGPRLDAESATLKQEVADMAEPRKVFQMEKGHIRQAMDTFRKACAEHQKHRKREGFEREVFWLEGSDLLHGEERDRSEERSIS